MYNDEATIYFEVMDSRNKFREVLDLGTDIYVVLFIKNIPTFFKIKN